MQIFSSFEDMNSSLNEIKLMKFPFVLNFPDAFLDLIS